MFELRSDNDLVCADSSEAPAALPMENTMRPPSLDKCPTFPRRFFPDLRTCNSQLGSLELATRNDAE